MTSEKTIHLYLRDLPPGVQNDKPVDDKIIYFENIIECVEEDNVCDKYSVLAALKQEQALFMEKTVSDLVMHNNGNYCNNHVLIDALLMYKTYVELVDESAFGHDIQKSCVEFLEYLFKLFRLQSKIVVNLPNDVNFEQDNLSVLLKHLLQLSIIEIA
ncbi:P18 [Buzura suppressaria nucleopolyhedrovirus]|uniref:p18 n=1 Tax=Buzura suppressaria nuclear polyhedrosis virus TaxID=74320 RepID=W5VL60_NPVBS|nr:P18 [Buzura suppressaria nucleopolyhedrovirus]AHH82659.1 P18 [Buzura suppressaria nucleopolyhedrovirus]AKN91042.1 P18 [Buzura suppressaria nucleopolyhedrovirus]QYF10560.1 P18 [Buzura suppressaria nucleopolyhedrovirus]